jgi:hypothetical protein
MAYEGVAALSLQRLLNMTFNTTEYQGKRLANQIDDAIDIGGDSAWIRCDGVINPDFLAGMDSAYSSGPEGSRTLSRLFKCQYCSAAERFLPL